LDAGAYRRAAIATDCPTALRPLAELLHRRKIRPSEFAAASAYLHKFNAGRTTKIDARIERVNLEIVRNLLVRQMAPREAVMAATGGCHPSSVLWRVSKALDRLGDALHSRQPA
jgi:hypothetical protein